MAVVSDDLRRRIIQAWQRKGLTTRELADIFDVGTATVTRLKRLYRETQAVERRPRGGGRRRLIDAEMEKRLEKLVRAHPDWTEDRYAAAMRDEHGLDASPATIGRAIRRLGYTVKKSPSSPASATARTSELDASSTERTSATSPLRVWFLWTKPARIHR